MSECWNGIQDRLNSFSFTIVHDIYYYEHKIYERIP